MKTIILIFTCLYITTMAAQTTDPAPVPVPVPNAAADPLPANFGALGVSYQPGGTVAGTGLYARLLTGGTYAFSVVDAVPQTAQKPYYVTTSFGVGIAQKLVTITVGRVAIPIFVPTTAGVSYSGGATGWNWTTGGLAVIPLGHNTSWKLLPNVRVLKSSVSNGDGYGVVIGVLLGWGW